MTTTVLAYFPSPGQGVWYLGPIPIRAYALCIIAGIIAAVIITERRLRARGVPAGTVIDVALWTVPLGIIAAGQPLYLCEGWATGATLHAETGHPVACAMNAGNLLEAGRHLQRRHPEAVLIVAGDDDRQTEGNPGKTAAIVAAAGLGCGLILPPWPADAPPHLSDFNDLRQWREAHA